MQRILFFLLLGMALAHPVGAQILGRLDYPQLLNDVWGWTAPDGTEYALVGTETGVAIVDLSDPTRPEEAFFVPGPYSIPRDIKTWEHYAYVIADQQTYNDGFTVIDLSGLPDTITHRQWKPFGAENTPFLRGHNLYIDEHGYAYVAGSNLNNGGVVIFDVFTNPGQPVFVGYGSPVYSHDVYVRSNIMYSSEIINGRFAVFDVTDKGEVIPLGVQETPLRRTHNSWLSDDGGALFTTDEVDHGSVAAYDISDPENAVLLDEFRPSASLGRGVSPHNVHVKDDFLVISYYTDGLIVVDGERPHNLVQMAQYDTSPLSGAGFAGVWGAYPYLPSGLILASDKQQGLFVIRHDYQRAAWLEGKVTDAISGHAIGSVTISLNDSLATQKPSEADGFYAIGVAGAGDYSVTFNRDRYFPQTIPVTLKNGVLTTLDVALQPIPTHRIQGQVLESPSGQPLPGAFLILLNERDELAIQADDEGRFTFNAVYEGTYDLYAGAWGYYQRGIADVEVTADDELVIRLEPGGYEDDFLFDLGWTTAADSTTTGGFWTRGRPIGTGLANQLFNPDRDAADDFGEHAYVTGNGGGGPETDDVDGGYVYLTSPVMDLSGFQKPELSLAYWLIRNLPEEGNYLEVLMATPKDTVSLGRIDQPTAAGSWGQSPVYDLSGSGLTPLDTVRIIFKTGDPSPGGFLEAGVDVFRVVDALANPTTSPDERGSLLVAPNPFTQNCLLRYDLATPACQAFIRLINGLGQPIADYPISDTSGVLEIGRELQPGLYFVQLVLDGQTARTIRLIKG